MFFAPNQGLAPHVWEILDPPLIPLFFTELRYISWSLLLEVEPWQQHLYCVLGLAPTSVSRVRTPSVTRFRCTENVWCSFCCQVEWSVEKPQLFIIHDYVNSNKSILLFNFPEFCDKSSVIKITDSTQKKVHYDDGLCLPKCIQRNNVLIHVIFEMLENYSKQNVDI